ncbi:adenylate/guanylate cyclase domain-containing protein [Nocardioides sp. KIGAM211]|uniref:Adenylate/guanylate cyclase domain-containing protein n=1 Tax=Nocardioides luti TaxID=2761101 RepID=A0A7X0VCF4_9ACTN|nr:adenylate/guanylate cyclase domain-containing protein [Nocardioides luti]
MALALRRSRRRVADLDAVVEALSAPTPGRERRRVLPGVLPGVLPSGLPTGREAVKAVWETAALVRDKGVGGALRSSIEDLAGWAQVERPDLARLADADGTVAILFSDIEGSTALNEQLGDRDWVRLLGKHDRIVRDRVDQHAGHVVKTQGDGFMVAFGTPRQAVGCAVDVQRSLAARRRRPGRTPLRVRIGVHQGDAVHLDGDLFGRNVAFAARVAGLAEGGEVLVSEPVRAALADDADLAFAEPREVELKGFAGVHAVHPVAWDGAGDE